MDAQRIPVSVRLNRNGIVEILRVIAVNRDRIPVPEILTAFTVGCGHALRKGTGFLQHLNRKLVRDAGFFRHAQDIKARIPCMPQKFDGFACRAFRFVLEAVFPMRPAASVPAAAEGTVIPIRRTVVRDPGFYLVPIDQMGQTARVKRHHRKAGTVRQEPETPSVRQNRPDQFRHAAFHDLRHMRFRFGGRSPERVCPVVQVLHAVACPCPSHIAGRDKQVLCASVLRVRRDEAESFGCGMENAGSCRRVLSSHEKLLPIPFTALVHSLSNQKCRRDGSMPFSLAWARISAFRSS